MPRPLIPDRRGRILDAARVLLLERGWSATTVSDIASRAGVAKGAVYLEFQNKTAILDALIRESTRRSIVYVRECIESSDRLVDLARAYRFGVEALLSDPLMRALYLGDADVLGAHMGQLPGQRYRERVDWLGDYVRQLQLAGVVDDGVDPDRVVGVMSTFTVGLVHSAGVLGPSGAEDLAATVELFADTISSGLATHRAPDIDAAHEAQLQLLQRLDDQLTELERNL